MTEDRAALVTGASSGIGLAVARALIADGFGVALAARRADRLEQLAQELGERALPVPTDVSRPRPGAGARRAHGQSGSAASTRPSPPRASSLEAPLEQIGEADFEETMGVNLKGTYLVAQAALPHLRASRGYLITLSSVSGTFGQAGGTAYNASKWGVRGFTHRCCRRSAGDGVRATAICPGPRSDADARPRRRRTRTCSPPRMSRTPSAGSSRCGRSCRSRT